MFRMIHDNVLHNEACSLLLVHIEGVLLYTGYENSILSIFEIRIIFHIIKRDQSLIRTHRIDLLATFT